MTIDARQLRHFAAVADTLHFGRAAERLHITQPPLTLAIQQLEARLGVPLFERTRRQVSLTPAGHALIEPVRQLLQQAASLAGIAQSAGHGAVGRLRLGFVSTVGFGPLPVWLRGFREAEPGVEVVLREATTDVQLRAFEQGVEHAARWEDAHTIAAGIRVPQAVGDFLILRAVRESGGFAIAVDDSAITAALDECARAEGFLMCPEGAATYAAWKQSLADGRIGKDERAVLFNCATGLKYPLLPQRRTLDRHKPIDFAAL